MTAERPNRRIIALLAVAGAALVTAIVLGSWQPWQTVAARPAPQAAEDAAVQPAPLTVPDDATVLVFGDSWTYGSVATAPRGGYAYQLGERTGWHTVVDGVRGSGYLRPGIDGPDYGTRIAALDPSLDPDLVIVQGSINDRRQDLSHYAEAVTAAWDDLARTYPDARIVILGPAPQVLPVERATARIDRSLAALAAARGWWYISPVADDWITPDNYRAVIDTSEFGRNHPSDAGHAYLADRLTAALEQLGTQVSIEASDERPDPALPGSAVDSEPSER